MTSDIWILRMAQHYSLNNGRCGRWRKIKFLYKVKQAQQPVEKLAQHVNKGAGNKTIV
jgi:hypothetical protein